MILLKKLFSVMTAFILMLYGYAGISGNVSDDYTEGKYKNVILMIGDGMSFNNLEATKALRGTKLAMETMPVKANSDIDSFLNTYTDSAAGGTALSCGIRVWNNSVAVFPFDPLALPSLDNVPVSIAELAKAKGKAAGVVTTDQTSGATPSAFSAHALSRTMESDISGDQLISGFDLIWGGASESINKENTAENGWTYVSTETELMALEEGSRSFAQFSFDDLKYVKNEHDTPTVEEMTVKAMELLSADEDGFFLMVEGACIDKHAHSNDMENMTLSAEEFDKAVAAALEFAEKDGETLVIVTADHGTGGMKYNAEKDEYYFTSGDHDRDNVPVYVSASDAGFINGAEVENREIPVQIARVFGYGEDVFPASVFQAGK